MGPLSDENKLQVDENSNNNRKIWKGFWKRLILQTLKLSHYKLTSSKNFFDQSISVVKKTKKCKKFSKKTALDYISGFL